MRSTRRLPMHLSQRARNTPASPIRRLAPLADTAKKRGTKVYHLNIGQPDLPSPLEFFEGISRFSDKTIAYDGSQGNARLREAWAAYMNESIGCALNPAQFLITMGASEALIFIFMLCCDPEDEVIVFDPTYANYLGFAAIAGVTLTPVQSELSTGYSLPPYEEIAKRVNGRTRAILLCNPNNPTGTVYSDEDTRLLLDICNDRNIFLIVDETYREFSYLDEKPRSVFQLDCHHERVVVIDSISKRFSLCGARIGCLITKNQELMHAALALASARLSAPTLEQAAAAHMLETIDRGEVHRSIAEYRHRRDVLWHFMRKVEGVESYCPDGAFYSLVKLPVAASEDFCTFMLRDFTYQGATTFVAPAGGFFLDPSAGRQLVRIAYVLEEDELRVALEVFVQGLKEYCKAPVRN